NASPEYMTEVDFGNGGGTEPSNMISPGSNSPLNSPMNDFEGSDDFSMPLPSIHPHSTKPTPLNIHHHGSFGESPGAGSLYSPGLESDFFPEGDFSLPTGTRPLD